MPIERRDTTAQIRSVLIGVVALIFAATLGYAIFRAASGTDNSVVSDTESASERFNAGEAGRLAELIAEDGPFFLPDPTGNGQERPIAISHSGGDEEEGWVAFVARPPQGSDDCFIEWNRDESYFEAACTDETWPVTGEGLELLDTEVEDGDLVIDIRGSS